MKNNVREQLAILNQLDKKQDELYHRFAVHLGISDATFWALYSLYAADEAYTQNTLAQAWCIPKQTLNSVMNNLVRSGYVRLVPMSNARNSKSIHLTEKGTDLCQHAIQPLVQAEQRAFSRLSTSERAAALSLTQKHCSYFQEELTGLLEAMGREGK